MPKNMPAKNIEIEAKWVKSIEPKILDLNLYTTQFIYLSDLVNAQDGYELVFDAYGSVEILDDKVIAIENGKGTVVVSIEGVNNSSVEISILVNDPQVLIKESSVLLSEDIYIKLIFQYQMDLHMFVKHLMTVF